MELILVVVGAIVVTAMAHRRGLEPALIIVVIGIAVSFLPGFEAPNSIRTSCCRWLCRLCCTRPRSTSPSRRSCATSGRSSVWASASSVTAFAVALASSWLVVVPLTFGTALVLGAIVASPTRSRRWLWAQARLPKRVMAILTGESLINDAAALTLFSIAVVQVAGGVTFIENPFLLFGYSALVGPLVGAALGYVTLWIRRRLANPGLETVQGLLVPFAAFICAEELHASGVLAVVVAGFVVGNGTLAPDIRRGCRNGMCGIRSMCCSRRSCSPTSGCICGSCSRICASPMTR